MATRFRDRFDAGRRLAAKLQDYSGRDDVTVLALPRGGVPVADETVCAVTPEPFYAVGVWYENFSQTTDEEVRDLLERAQREVPGAPAVTARAPVTTPART